MSNHPREAPPSSRWGRSKKGTYFYVIYTTKRNAQGRKLYRLLYPGGTASNLFWTLEELNEAGVRWLKRKPSGVSFGRSKT